LELERRSASAGVASGEGWGAVTRIEGGITIKKREGWREVGRSQGRNDVAASAPLKGAQPSVVLLPLGLERGHFVFVLLIAGAHVVLRHVLHHLLEVHPSHAAHAAHPSHAAHHSSHPTHAAHAAHAAEALHAAEAAEILGFADIVLVDPPGPVHGDVLGLLGALPQLAPEALRLLGDLELDLARRHRLRRLLGVDFPIELQIERQGAVAALGGEGQLALREDLDDGVLGVGAHNGDQQDILALGPLDFGFFAYWLRRRRGRCREGNVPWSRAGED